MPFKMLINARAGEECRVSILDDEGVLQDLGIESSTKQQIQGNIYKAVISRIEPSIEAAFVNFGGPKNGFLPASEIHPKYWKNRNKVPLGGKTPRIQDLVEPKQQLLVQVVQEQRGNKGALLSTYLSLPGRYLVMMPGVQKLGVSKKLKEQSERDRLKQLLEKLKKPEEIGIIARTAAEKRTKNELSRELKYLTRLWKNIQQKASKSAAPSLIYQETNLAIRTIRDYLSPDIEEIIVDDADTYVQVKDFIKTIMPRNQKMVKLHKDKIPLFSKYGIEDQIEAIHQKTVKLKSGGTLVIEPTEALVSIDVNTSKSNLKGNQKETILQTNLEAASETARQLRLRDLGGLIVIDFIDMDDRSHRLKVEKALRDAFKEDKARVRISRISPFGLVEMSRQRLLPEVQRSGAVVCPQCMGSGLIRSVESHAASILRKIRERASEGSVKKVIIRLPVDLLNYFINAKKNELAEIENSYGLVIEFKSEPAGTKREPELRFITKKAAG